MSSRSTDRGPEPGPTDRGPEPGPTDRGPEPGSTDRGPEPGLTNRGPEPGLTGFGRYAGPATLILSSLADGAKHGYALTKDIESFSGVRLPPGTLYEALARLQAQGLIEPVESHDRRRPYRLTAVGAQALRAHLDAQRQIADVGLRRLASGWGTA